MGIVNGIWLVVLGILGASSLIIAKKPNAKEMIDKLTPFQGWIGAVSAIWGVWVIIQAVLNLSWLTTVPIAWSTLLAIGIVLFGLGLLLGVGVLKTFIKQPKAVENMDKMIVKLSPYQGTLGLIAIGLGIWGVLYSTVLFKILLK